jgi:hypothetical protein
MARTCDNGSCSGCHAEVFNKATLQVVLLLPAPGNCALVTLTLLQEDLRSRDEDKAVRLMGPTLIPIFVLDFHSSCRFRTFCRVRDRTAPTPLPAAAIAQTAWSSWTLPLPTPPILFGNTLRCADCLSVCCSLWRPCLVPKRPLTHSPPADKRQLEQQQLRTHTPCR